MLIRAGSAGGTHDFQAWLAKPGRRLAYSVGMIITGDIEDAIRALPEQAKTWLMTPAASRGPARESPS